MKACWLVMVCDLVSGRLCRVGCCGDDMMGEIALSIEMGTIGKTIHPRKTRGESIGMAGEVAYGFCSDGPQCEVSI